MVQSLNLLVKGNHLCGTGNNRDGSAKGCPFIGIWIKETRMFNSLQLAEKKLVIESNRNTGTKDRDHEVTNRADIY